MLFDAVVLAVSKAGAEELATNPAAINFIRDAYVHLKVIGCVKTAALLLEKAGIHQDEGVVSLDSNLGATPFIDMAKQGRVWPRAGSMSR